MKFSIKEFFGKCHQVRRNLILLKESLMENFIFCAVKKGRIQKTVKHLKWSFLQKHFCIQTLIYCIIHIQFRKLLSETYCPEKILSLDLRNLKIAFVFTIRELLISFH